MIGLDQSMVLHLPNAATHLIQFLVLGWLPNCKIIFITTS